MHGIPPPLAGTSIFRALSLWPPPQGLLHLLHCPQCDHWQLVIGVLPHAAETCSFILGLQGAISLRESKSQAAPLPETYCEITRVRSMIPKQVQLQSDQLVHRDNRQSLLGTQGARLFLHCWYSVRNPSNAFPQAFASCATTRLLERYPSSQVAEHSDHSPQCPHLPFRHCLPQGATLHGSA